MRIFGWILRGLLAVDFALFVLAFVPAFSGIGPEPGVADRLWGNYRFGGWRADVVWMCASSVFIIVAGFPWIKQSRSAKITRFAWFLWLGCFPVYLCYTVIHMFG